MAFELSPSSTGKWALTDLCDFEVQFGYSSLPYSNLVFDSMGDLWGTTLQGGISPGYGGTIFELVFSGGVWNCNQVWNFAGTGGERPAVGALIFDTSGNLYGATQDGGANKDGVVFELTPGSMAPGKGRTLFRRSSSIGPRY